MPPLNKKPATEYLNRKILILKTWCLATGFQKCRNIPVKLIK